MLRSIQKMLCVLLAVALLAAIAVPVLAEEAESNTSVTAYTNRATYVYKTPSTSSQHRSVSKNTKVIVVGKSGSFCKVRAPKGNTYGYIKTEHLSCGTGWKSKVVKMNWFGGGQSVLRTGAYGYIYDIDTGIVVRIKRMGGHYHADVEPATAADTLKLLRIARGKFSWDSHAVILYAGGKFVACGINTMPHGDQTIRNNNYNGQFCLHMCGSLTHCSSAPNVNHQNSINRAYNWAHR